MQKKIGKFQDPHDILMIMLKKLRTDLRICEKKISANFSDTDMTKEHKAFLKNECVSDQL